MDEDVWKYLINLLTSLFASKYVGHHGLHGIDWFDAFTKPLLTNFIHFVFENRVSLHDCFHVFVAHLFYQVNPLCLHKSKEHLCEEQSWGFLALLNASVDDKLYLARFFCFREHVNCSFGVEQVVF